MDSAWPILVFIWGLLVVIVVHLLLPSGRAGGARGAGSWNDDWRRGDDRCWIGGLISNHPDDPDLFAPKRFGIGWTLNLGRPLRQSDHGRDIAPAAGSGRPQGAFPLLLTRAQRVARRRRSA